MGSKNRKGFTELTITNVDPEVKKKIKAIAKNKGATFSYLLRPILREFINSHPEEQHEFKC